MSASRRLIDRARFTELSVALLLAACSPAFAQIDCWADAEHPKTADLRAVSDPVVAPLRRMLHSLNALLHARPGLHALPRTRLRSSWQIGGQWDAPARPAHFLLRDHRESVWVAGRCDVVTGADRIGAQATIVASINAPHAFFGSEVPELKDDQFAAWRELPVTGTLRGRPVHGGHMLVFTRHGLLPWVPVTTAEYLDFTERDLQRKRDEARVNEAAARAAAAPAAQDEMLERVTEGLRRTDPANAERLIAEIRAQHAQARAGEAAAQARRRSRQGVDEAPLETMLRRVRAWRAGLSAAQLAAPARLGLNGLHAPDVPLERYPRLAKPDPAFPWDRANPAQAQMVKLEVRGVDNFEQPMQRAMEALDLDALDALVRER
ncbi:hypothetical protein [Rhizobacter sp. Root404]|uniref:hypothetical protein n=1 Tax=Rhizobacter sp. Root404 TaxID=1736528 RepID=UPI0006FB3F3C|nr:hypothetical protein [Rhizobacter sp. Root404]KQW39956.1 hypothetical protein ASC76_00370 [Rhizobacter sp. Root404]